MPRYVFEKPGWKAALLDELVAAGITARVEGDDATVWIETEASEGSVTAVVEAHNPAVIDAAQASAQVDERAWRTAVRTYVETLTTTTAQDKALLKGIARAILRADNGR